MSGFYNSTVRTFRSLLPASVNPGETFGFARIRTSNRHDDDTEISTGMPQNCQQTIKDEDVPCYSPKLRSRSCSLSAKEVEMGKCKSVDYEDLDIEGESLKSGTKISAWQAGWNVTNAIQGMFIVSFPYTVFQGGYWALVSMCVIAYICCYTGKILVECLYEEVEWTPGGSLDGPKVWEKRRVRSSYVGIAAAVWGKKLGGGLVCMAQLIELMMTCILYVLLCGKLMLDIFPDSSLDLTAWIMIYTLVLLPCAFLRNLRHVAMLSFWCTVAHLFINAIIIVYCFFFVTQWQFQAVQVKVDIWTFPISLEIIVFSYTSQIFLPSLEGSLADRSKFAPMMHWTHFAAAIFKVAFAYIGFVTFGTDTKEVITSNLPSHTMKVIVNCFLIAKALLSYPLPYFATAELLESTFFKGRPHTLFPSCYDESGTIKFWSLGLRLGLVIVTMLLAIFIPHFSLLMSLIGSITGNMLSLIWPAYFHLSIKGHGIGIVQKLVNIFILLLGVVCSAIGIYFSTHALVKAFQGVETRPFQRN